MKKVLIITIVCFIFGFFGVSNTVHAANVNINSKREYIVREDAKVDVTETRTVYNNTIDKVITKQGNSEIFTITALYKDKSENNRKILEKMVSTISVTDNAGIHLMYSIDYNDDSAVITVPYTQSIGAKESYIFILKYTNNQLVQRTGALVDIFIQAFSKDFKFSTPTVDYSYQTILKVPVSFKEENFIIPTPASKKSDGIYDIYTFTQEQLVGTYIWVQRGIVQYYKFQITQKVPATEKSITGNKNEYRMVLPRNQNTIKTTQKIFFTKITPQPNYVEEDDDGNLIGVFLLPSNKDIVITISGYAIVQSLKNIDINAAGKLNDYVNLLDSHYTEASQFWEVNAPEIQAKANELKGSKTDIYEILEDTYKYVVDSIDYSQVKRFGVNIRQGALKTLLGGAAVCMEYSDLYITLLRAAGIPAQAAFGYGYDSKEPADKQELHQWVQAYIPTHNKWLNIDVTWGENGPALIGGDMNHFLTHVASINPNDPPTLSGKTYGSRIEFDPVNFSVEVLEFLPDEEMTSIEELIQKYQQQNKSDISSLFDEFITEFNAGIASFSEEGFNMNNSAQLIVITTGIIVAIIIIVICSLASKIVRRYSNAMHHVD